jgi:hypothetical protein
MSWERESKEICVREISESLEHLNWVWDRLGDADPPDIQVVRREVRNAVAIIETYASTLAEQKVTGYGYFKTKKESAK